MKELPTEWQIGAGLLGVGLGLWAWLSWYPELSSQDPSVPLPSREHLLKQAEKTSLVKDRTLNSGTAESDQHRLEVWRSQYWKAQWAENRELTQNEIFKDSSLKNLLAQDNNTPSRDPLQTRNRDSETTSNPVNMNENKIRDHNNPSLQAQSEKSSLFVSTNQAKKKQEESQRHEISSIPLNQLVVWQDYLVKTPSSKKNAPNTPLFPKDQVLNRRLVLFHGDIVQLQTDAIVNSANIYLEEYGAPMDKKIRATAGPRLSKELEMIIQKLRHPLSFGSCEISLGYQLPCKYVIHGVGPIDNSTSVLEKLYWNILEKCKAFGIRSVAFCCVFSSFVSVEAHLHTAFRVFRRFLENPQNSWMETIVITGWAQKELVQMEEIAPLYFPRQ